MNKTIIRIDFRYLIKKFDLLLVLNIFILFFALRSLTMASDLAETNFSIGNSTANIGCSLKNNNVLRLELKILLGSGDLKNAYKVCREGIVCFPQDPYWLEWCGKISTWMGNTEEGLDYYYKAFKISKNISLAKKMYDLYTIYHNWNMAEKMLQVIGNSVSLQDKVYVYQKAGNPNKLIDLLQSEYSRRKSKKVLNYLIYTYWDVGDIKNTIKTIKELENRFGLSISDVLMYANTLTAEKDYYKALNVLKNYRFKVNKNDFKFWDELSDLAWMLGDYKTAVDASINLVSLQPMEITENKVDVNGNIQKISINYRPGRSIDYERIYEYYSKTNPNIAMKYALLGWKIYHLPYLFDGFVYSAARNKMWNSILTEIDNLDKKDFTALSNNVYFMLAYIDALEKTGDISEAKKLCLEQLNKKFEPDFLSELIYLSLESNDKSMLNYIVKEFKNEPKRYASLAPSFIYLYLYFENGQKALFLSKYLQQNPTVDNELLYADVLSLYGDRGKALEIRYKSWVQMKKQLKSDPLLFNDAHFMENFLSVSMRFDHYKEFNKILEFSKKTLPLNTYYEFRLSYELFRNHREKALYLQKKYKYVLKPWMMLDIALWSRDTYLQEKLLQEWLDVLPIRDRVTSLTETGNIYKAFDYAFKGLEENRDDDLLYDQFRNIADNYSNVVNFNTQYISWDGYREVSENIFFKYNFLGGIIVTPFIKIGKEISYNRGNIINVPYKHYNIGMMLEKEYSNFNIKSSFGVISSLDTNPYFSINPNFKITSSTEVGFLYGEHIEADDNLFLYLGGLKRELQATLRQNITQRTSLNLSVVHDWFLSQNNKTIGSDNGLYSELDYRLREAYPDYTLRSFVQIERYNQSGGVGNIAKLSPYANFDPLPSSYNLAGVGFVVGDNYKDTLEKRWRPFLNGDIFYETGSGSGLGYDVGGGYGGSVAGNDNLSVGTTYYTNFHGSSSSYFQVSINYRIYF